MFCFFLLLIKTSNTELKISTSQDLYLSSSSLWAQNYFRMSSKPSSHHMASADIVCSLECPVCFETCLPPLLQCPNGHLVCASSLLSLNIHSLLLLNINPYNYFVQVCSVCSPKLEHCPICQGKLGIVPRKPT